MGPGLTFWTGTAFDCPAIENGIILRHILFLSTYRTSGECNNGAIVARSLPVEGNNYTSQLNVTLTSDTAGKTVVCLYDNGISITTQLSTVIPTIGLSLCIAS